MHDFRPFHRYLGDMEITEGTRRLKDTVRQYVIGNYPVAHDEIVLGELAGRRVLHSPFSASKYANVSRPRLVAALRAIRSGGAFPHLPRPTRYLWVPCKEWDPWLKEYSETIGIKEAARTIGASTATLQQVIAEDWLKPFVAFDKQVPRFHPDSLSNFAEQMRQDAHPIDTLDKTMIPIEHAPSVFAISMIEILRLVWERRLKALYLRSSAHGLCALVFDREEVLGLLERPGPDALSCEEARCVLRVASSTMALLHQRRIIETVRGLHRRTRKTVIKIKPEAMDDFLATYETLGRLAQSENTHAKSVLIKLLRLGIEPLPLPASHSKIFRREDLRPYFS